MLIEGEIARLTLNEVSAASVGALDQGNKDMATYLTAKAQAYLEQMDGVVDDPDMTVNDVPSEMPVIEVPARPQLIEALVGYISIGTELDRVSTELATRYQKGGPASQQRRPRPEVKARHKAPYLRIVPEDTDD